MYNISSLDHNDRFNDCFNRKIVLVMVEHLKHEKNLKKAYVFEFLKIMLKFINLKHQNLEYLNFFKKEITDIGTKPIWLMAITSYIDIV